MHFSFLDYLVNYITNKKFSSRKKIQNNNPTTYKLLNSTPFTYDK